ncbi:hypothetical protein ACN27F_17025 [Solwaraspora sp. WMMB335]|uniref:hypothetical protein n=1 Tax=Solwaraspora sp. WMMB335 TaxID=3404118 RepID=UPI003B92B498
MIIRRPAVPRWLPAVVRSLAAVVSVTVAASLPVAAVSAGAVPAAQPPGGDAVVQWSVTPANGNGPDGRTRFSYTDVRPGAVVRDHVSITNLGNTPVTFHVYAADGITTANGSISVATADVPATDLAAWTRVARTSVRVPARTKVVEPFTILVPVNATPGDHVGGVIASIREQADGGTVVREDRFAVAVYLRVAGELAPALSVESVSTSYAGTANPFGGGAGTVAYTVRNSGNVRLAGIQTVTISGPFGTRATVHPTALEELLPGDSVRVTARLSGVLPTGPLQARVTVVPGEVPNAPPLSAELEPASYTAGLWATPWPQLLLLLAVLVGGAGLWWWLRQRRRHLARRLAAAVEQGRRAGAAAITLVGGVLLAVVVSTVTGGPAGTSPAEAADVHGGQPVTVTVPRHPVPELTCDGADGEPLGDDATLHPGDQLSCTGTQFVAGEQVAVTLDPGSRGVGTVTADSQGRASHQLSLPADLGAGRHTLTFTGQTSRTTASYSFRVTIVATLPVGGGSGLPRTGADVLRLVGAGIALVVVGGVVAVSGRLGTRRRARRRPTGMPRPVANGERG